MRRERIKTLRDSKAFSSQLRSGCSPSFPVLFLENQVKRQRWLVSVVLMGGDWSSRKYSCQVEKLGPAVPASPESSMDQQLRLICYGLNLEHSPKKAFMKGLVPRRWRKLSKVGPSGKSSGPWGQALKEVLKPRPSLLSFILCSVVNGFPLPQVFTVLCHQRPNQWGLWVSGLNLQNCKPK